jgi:hypothetical protein
MDPQSNEPDNEDEGAHAGLTLHAIGTVIEPEDTTESKDS